MDRLYSQDGVHAYSPPGGNDGGGGATLERQNLLFTREGAEGGESIRQRLHIRPQLLFFTMMHSQVSLSMASTEFGLFSPPFSLLALPNEPPLLTTQTPGKQLLSLLQLWDVSVLHLEFHSSRPQRPRKQLLFPAEPTLRSQLTCT